MARGTTLKQVCPFCGETGIETSRFDFGSEILISLQCGHTIAKSSLESEELKIVSNDGRELFPYQLDGVRFFEEQADCNGLLLDEQGLGKTVQIAALVQRNKKQLLPMLAVVPSQLRAQIFAEMWRWAGIAAQIITSSKEQPYPELFPICIVSVDTLRLVRPDVKVISDWDIAIAEAKGKKLEKTVAKWSDETCAKFKFIWCDESQKIKNPGSSRTQALRLIAGARMRLGQEKPRVICTSGTNIEKHAGEYFVTLNLTRPELFPQQSTYQLQHCEINPETGKVMGLKDPERFRELTKDFILRRKREEVMPDLPKVFRQFQLAELEGDELTAYLKILKEFMKMSEDPERPMTPTDILGYLSRMRHVTGIAKTKATVEFVKEFLVNCDRKIVVFLHHKMGAAILLEKLGKVIAELKKEHFEETGEELKLNIPLHLPGGLKMGEGSRIIEQFKLPENRILLASELAAGVGYNMQFCSDCLFMERQWNPSAEEQCEGRFPRPRPEDPWPADYKINAHYLIAAGTIDDFLTDIIETKRRNVAQTLDYQEIEWDEKSIQMELAKVLQVRGLQKWKLVA
jgi:SNF2 family DNA or RNA helicase